MEAVKIGLQVLLVIGGLFLTLLILLHKGKGGGLSDMFGGGMSSSLGRLVRRGAQPRPVHRRVGIVWFISSSVSACSPVSPLTVQGSQNGRW